MDQVLGERLAGRTKFPVQNLRVAPTSFDREGHMGGFFSWKAGSQPVPAEWNPQTTFARLFSDAGGAPVGGTSALEAFERARARRQSVLSSAAEGLNDLGKRLGGADRERVDAHLSAVRALEKRLHGATDRCDRCWLQ